MSRLNSQERRVLLDVYRCCHEQHLPFHAGPLTRFMPIAELERRRIVKRLDSYVDVTFSGAWVRYRFDITPHGRHVAETIIKADAERARLKDLRDRTDALAKKIAAAMQVPQHLIEPTVSHFADILLTHRARHYQCGCGFLHGAGERCGPW